MYIVLKHKLHIHKGHSQGFPGGSCKYHLPEDKEAWVRIPGLEDLLESEMTTYFSILIWKNSSRTEEPGEL